MRARVGMTIEEFDSLSLQELKVLLDRVEQDERAADYRAGIVWEILAAVYREEGSPPPHALDRFPKWWGDEDYQAQKEAALERIERNKRAKQETSHKLLTMKANIARKKKEAGEQ